MAPEATCEWTTTSFTAAAALSMRLDLGKLSSAVYECDQMWHLHHCARMFSYAFIVFWGDLMTHRSHKDFDLADLSGSVESRP